MNVGKFGLFLNAVSERSSESNSVTPIPDAPRILILGKAFGFDPISLFTRRVAQAIAAKIHKIGQNGQVLAISHLPQVIAAADYQFYIEKISDEHSTVSTVRLLNREERIEEIAKMLAGEDLTEAARQQAEQLLKR